MSLKILKNIWFDKIPWCDSSIRARTAT